MASLAAKTSFSRSITSTFPANTKLDTSPTAIFPSSLPPARCQAPQKAWCTLPHDACTDRLTARMPAGLDKGRSTARTLVTSFEGCSVGHRPGL